MLESPVPFSPLKTPAWVRIVTVSIVVVLKISGESSPQIPAASALTTVRHYLHYSHHEQLLQDYISHAAVHSLHCGPQ